MTGRGSIREGRTRKIPPMVRTVTSHSPKNRQSALRLRWPGLRRSQASSLPSANALTAARGFARAALGSNGFAKRFERRPHLRDEGLRLFPRREVAALGKLVVVDELRVSPLGPTARGLVKLLREGADGNRDLDAPHVEETSRCGMHVVPVKARRGDRGVRQPVERDV